MLHFYTPWKSISLHPLFFILDLEYVFAIASRYLQNKYLMPIFFIFPFPLFLFMVTPYLTLTSHIKKINFTNYLYHLWRLRV